MDNIRDFLTELNVKDLIKLFNIQIAIIVAILFFLLRGVFSQIILKIFFKITKNKQKIKQTKIYKILSNFFIFLGLYLGIMILKPSEKVLGTINLIFKIISIIFVTNIVNSFITKDSKLFVKSAKNSKNDTVNGFICRIIRGIVWVISIYIILKELNYDLTGLVAGFGIGGVIISLAAQDTVKSLLSGIVILTDRPFEIGDFIEVGNYKGIVQDITFRSTRIKKDLDSAIITIPNSVITSEYVVNWDKHQFRKLEFTLNLSMNTSAEKIKDIIEKIKFMLKNYYAVDPKSVQVNLSEISSYSTDIRIFLYINEPIYKEFLEKKQKIYYDILELVELENIDLAYPTQTLYVKNVESSKLDKKEAEIEELIGEEDELLAMKILAEQENKKKKQEESE